MLVNFWRNISLILFVLCLVLYTCNGCLKGKLAKMEQPKGEVIKRDTTVKTVYVKTTDSFYREVPKPYRIVDSFIAFEVQSVDTLTILRDHFASVFYIDSIETKYGKVKISDTLSKNRLIGRGVVTDFTIPHTTTTITNTVQQKTTQLYAGLNLQGSKENILSGIGGSLMLKTKQDRIYEVGALIGPDGRLIYQAGIKFKISLK